MRQIYGLIAIISLAGAFPITAQTSGDSLPIPKGWRLPGVVDVKRQWIKKTWDDECQKFRAADEKASYDAVEEIGDVPVSDASKPATENDGDDELCFADVSLYEDAAVCIVNLTHLASRSSRI